MERYLTTNYLSAMAWVLVVLGAIIGIGRVAARWVEDAPRQANWGLHAVWGLAIFIFVGGTLAAVGLCGKAAIMGLLILGCIAFVWEARTSLKHWRSLFQRGHLGILPTLIVAIILFVGGVGWTLNLNPGDDHIAYFSFTEKLLTNGTIVEPFSWRRLASLGGQTLLMCAVLAQTCYLNVQAFETAICPIILFGLLTGFRGGVMRKSLTGCFVCFVAMTTCILRINTTSHFTGIVMFLGLFITMDMIEQKSGRLPLWLMAGMIAAGMCSLRSNYIPAAGAALGLFWLLVWWQERWSAAQSAKVLAVWSGALFVALVPWMIQTYVSNGTPLYPFINGNNGQGFNPYGAKSFVDRIALSAQLLTEPSIVPLLLFPIAWLRLRSDSAASCVGIAGLITAVLLSFSITLAPIGRYLQPFLLAGGLAALMARVASGKSVWIAGGLAAVALIQNPLDRYENLIRHIDMLGDVSELHNPYRPSVISSHHEAQKVVPEGARILVCSDFSVLFDHKRNVIWNIDMPGGTSPGAGLPFHRPPAETKRYLLGLGVRYLILTNFTSSSALYSRKQWEEHRDGEASIYRDQSPYYLDFFDTAEALAKSETNLGRFRNLTVIRLEP